MKNYIKSIGLATAAIILSVNLNAQSKHQVGVNVISGVDYLMDNKLDQPDFSLQYKRLGKWNLRAGFRTTSLRTSSNEREFFPVYSQDINGNYWMSSSVTHQRSYEDFVRDNQLFLGIEKNWNVSKWDFQLGANGVAGLGYRISSYSSHYNETIKDQFNVTIDEVNKIDLMSSKNYNHHIGFNLSAGVERELSEHFSLWMVYRFQALWYKYNKTIDQRYSNGELMWSDEHDGSGYSYSRNNLDPLYSQLQNRFFDLFVNFTF